MDRPIGSAAFVVLLMTFGCAGTGSRGRDGGGGKGGGGGNGGAAGGGGAGGAGGAGGGAGSGGGGGAGGGAPADGKADVAKEMSLPEGAAEALFESPPAESPPLMCGDLGGTASGSCPADLMCLGCSGAGPIAWHICSTSCKSDADCKAPERPLCQMPPGPGSGESGFCVSPPGLACCWGCN